MDNGKIWLPEPTAIDESYKREGETTVDWLLRSSDAFAGAIRAFLNFIIPVA